MNLDEKIITTAFLKMHGLGNDFIVLDARNNGFALDAKTIRQLSNRRTGIGCDQLLLLESSTKADVFMRIYNADGGEVGQCGNGTRCIAHLIMDEKSTDKITIETASGLLYCHKVPGGVAIDMGEPIFDWETIPLSEERDTKHLGLKMGALSDPVALSVGNPHVVFFVENAEDISLATLGPKIETYFLFPERVNVNVAEIKSPSEIRLRVWERGTGITQACGTGACATLVAAATRGLTDRKATILMDGGKLSVEWNAENRIILSGPAETAFKGKVKLPAPKAKENVA
jgi:diaminopimelate epimerase